MAWLFDAATDKVLVGSGWSGSVATILLWVKRSSSASNSHGNNPWRAWSNASGGGSTLAGLDVQGSARTTVVSFDSAFSNITGGDIRSDAGWHPLALVMNGTAWALYYGNDPAALTKVTGTKASTGTVGSWTLSDAAPDWFDGAISNVKLFSRALSDSEVAAELADPAQISSTNLIFRGTLNTTSTTPETGTTMTAGSTGVTAVPGPALVVTSTTTAVSATARLVLPANATSATTTATTAAARPAGAATSATTTATSAAARPAGAATSTTTTATSAAARAAADVVSVTTTATTAAARTIVVVVSTTTTTTTAAARPAGTATSTTTTRTQARAHDLTPPAPPGPYRAGTPVLAGCWRSTSPTRTPVLAPGWGIGVPS